MKRVGVGFDLGDTLCEYEGVPLNWEREYPAALAAVAATCGRAITRSEIDSGSRVLSKYNTRITPRDNDREYDADQIFSEVLRAWEFPTEVLGACISAFFRHFRRSLRAFPDSARVLKELGKVDTPIGVLTDVPYGMPRTLAASDLVDTQLTLPDSHFLTSTMVGHRKPNPAGFRALAQLLDVSPNNLTYVGNERKDILGGNAAGSQTILLWRADADVPGWGQAFTIRSLDELLPFLGF